MSEVALVTVEPWSTLTLTLTLTLILACGVTVAPAPSELMKPAIRARSTVTARSHAASSEVAPSTAAPSSCGTITEGCVSGWVRVTKHLRAVRTVCVAWAIEAVVEAVRKPGGKEGVAATCKHHPTTPSRARLPVQLGKLLGGRGTRGKERGPPTRYLLYQLPTPSARSGLVSRRNGSSAGQIQSSSNQALNPNGEARASRPNMHATSVQTRE